ncbi:hypothetical protein GCM10025867_47390 (plasmid) [Frondihabitans sucicola]|uniref:Uncharacterized protein n=1 Tax=Frondihabitans sucicola TaxID=1268041 RepID=A0ABM8GVK2_9MICO|nr:hypothetical protein [Frondihabitans sucicola]BDZ52498.1 hypothetical protein GCM10025867_47390 [Frondihabitans sucicola]
MTHLAWIAVDSFRPLDSHRDVIVDFAITVTDGRLAPAMSEQSAILDPGTNPLLLRNSAAPDDQDRFAATGLWNEINARAVSVGSFDRLIASRLRALGVTPGAPALAICSQIERGLIATYAPEMSAMLSVDAADVTSFRLLSGQFLPGAGLVTAAPRSGRTDNRVQARLNDLANTVNAINHQIGTAAA